MKKIFLFLALALTVCYPTKAQDNIKLPERPKNRTNYTDYSVKVTGYWTAVELNGGSTTMFNRKNIQPIEIRWINGYRFNEFLKAGIGVGGKYFINNDKVRSSSIPWTFPVFLDLRGNIISQQDRGAVPYWSLDAGAEIRGGFYFSPTLGYRIGEPRNSFLIGITYSLSTQDTWKKDNENIHSVSLKLGYEF